MIEFTEDLHTRLVGKDAAVARVTLRVSIRKGEIPHYNRGLDMQEFTYDQHGELRQSVLKALSDFDTTVEVENGRVVVASLGVSINL